MVPPRIPDSSIIPQTTMKNKLLGTVGLACGIAAAACTLSGLAPWIGALFAIAAGIDCLTLGLFGGHDD